MRTRRGSIAVALVVVLAVLLGTGSVAGAAEIPVTGTLTAEGSFDSPPGCPAFHTWHDGGGTWTGLGVSTFNLDYCVVLAPEGPSPLDGTFTITAEDGTLTGRVTGSIAGAPVSGGWPGHYELTVTGGTGAYEQATGTLVFEVLFTHPTIPVLTMEGTVAGSINVPPATPTSRDDCRHGGWRDVVDEHGQPFRNVGDCISWVNHHT